MPAAPRIRSIEHRRLLLHVARQTAHDVFSGTKRAVRPAPSVEGRFGGAFVTFWAGKRLRGCVGRFGSTDDVVQTVADMTRESIADSRFKSNPITADELSSLEIEISILSDLEPTKEPVSLVCGTHGVLIRKGDRSGCFLPKVATECGWSAEQFLSNCCTMKAGLPADAWRQPDTTVSLFTAEVLSESQVGHGEAREMDDP